MYFFQVKQTTPLIYSQLKLDYREFQILYSNYLNYYNLNIILSITT